MAARTDRRRVYVVVWNSGHSIPVLLRLKGWDIPRDWVDAPIGHTAILLDTGQRFNLYLSFYPNGGGKKLGGSEFETYAIDTQRGRKPPTHVFALEVEEAQIAQMIEYATTTALDTPYNATSYNCSTAVARTLASGGIHAGGRLWSTPRGFVDSLASGAYGSVALDLEDEDNPQTMAFDTAMATARTASYYLAPVAVPRPGARHPAPWGTRRPAMASSASASEAGPTTMQLNPLMHASSAAAAATAHDDGTGVSMSASAAQELARDESSLFEHARATEPAQAPPHTAASDTADDEDGDDDGTAPST